MPSLELFCNGGPETSVKCKFGHVGAQLTTLRTKEHKETIHIWYDCPGCASRNPSGKSWRVPLTVEEAVALLRKTGKLNRPNIRKLVYGR